MGHKVFWLSRLLILASLFFVGNVYSVQLSEKLNLGGYLRNRYWNFYASVPIPDTNLNQKYTSYFDLLLRSRFDYSVSRGIAIQAVFDIYTVYGQTSSGEVETVGGALGKPGFNLATRNLFVTIQDSNSLQLRFGLLPFSLPQGYILAKDGAGIRIEYAPDIPYFNPYLFWIRAVENSFTNAEEDGLQPHDIRNDDIFIMGNKTSITSQFRFDLYYSFRNDFDRSDEISGKLHWIGLHVDNIWKDFQTTFLSIYNFGEVKTASGNTVTISAALWGFRIGYEITNVTLSGRIEGATGSDARDPYTKDAFQTIAPSRGVSRILLDDSGGLAIRKGGDLFGINSTSLELLWKYTANLEMAFSIFYFLLTNKIKDPSGSKGDSRDLGGEIDFSLNYRFHKNLEVNHTLGIFYPLKGYFNLVDHPQNNKPILEVLLGVKVSF